MIEHDRNLALLMSAFFELRKDPASKDLTDDQVFDRALELLHKAEDKIYKLWSRAPYMVDARTGPEIRGRGQNIPFSDLVKKLTNYGKKESVERVRRFLSEQFDLSETKMESLEKDGVSPQLYGEAVVQYDWWNKRAISATNSRTARSKKSS